MKKYFESNFRFYPFLLTIGLTYFTKVLFIASYNIYCVYLMGKSVEVKNTPLDDAEFLEYLFIGVFGAALLEEFLFRYILQNLLLRIIGPALAIITTAVLFGSGHGYQGEIGIVGATISGLLWGWIYYRTNDLTYPLLLHMLFNFFVYVHRNYLVDTTIYHPLFILFQENLYPVSLCCLVLLYLLGKQLIKTTTPMPYQLIWKKWFFKKNVMPELEGTGENGNENPTAPIH